MENSKKKRNLCAIATFNPVQFNVIYIASRRFIRNVIYYFKLMQYLHEMYNWLLFYEAKSHIHCFPSFIMCGQHWFISIHHKRSVPVTQIRSDPDVHKIAFRISLLSQKKKKKSLKKKNKTAKSSRICDVHFVSRATLNKIMTHVFVPQVESLHMLQKSRENR